MDNRRRPQFRRDLGLAMLIALAVQSAFTILLALPDINLPVTARLIVGLSSVPLSALCGTLFIRRHHRNLFHTQLALVFGGLAVVVVVVAFLVSAATGNYDLP
jgi:hypothetical protein